MKIDRRSFFGAAAAVLALFGVRRGAVAAPALSEASAGGLCVVPLEFDDALVMTPICYGERFPTVTLKARPIPFPLEFP
jgi:hypothetical protein